MERGRLLVRSSAVALLPAAGSLTVLAAMGLFNWAIDLDDPAIGLPAGFAFAGPDRDLTFATRELATRIAWAVTGVVTAVAVVVALGVAVQSLARSVASWPRQHRLAALAGVVVVGLLLVADQWLPGGSEWFLAEPQLTTDLRRETLRQAALAKAIAVEAWLTTLAYGVYCLLLGASCALLVSPARGGKRPIEELAGRLRRLQRLLYAGAAVLVAAVIEMHAFYRWPGAWLPEEAARHVDRLATVISTSTGTVCTLLLLGLYFPALLVLRYRADYAVAEEMPAASEAERQERLNAMGLTFSSLPELKRLAAVFGPLLAGGPLPTLLGLLES